MHGAGQGLEGGVQGSPHRAGGKAVQIGPLGSAHQGTGRARRTRPFVTGLSSSRVSICTTSSGTTYSSCEALLCPSLNRQVLVIGCP